MAYSHSPFFKGSPSCGDTALFWLSVFSCLCKSNLYAFFVNFLSPQGKDGEKGDPGPLGATGIEVCDFLSVPVFGPESLHVQVFH